jgi:hypothetical protein
MDIRTALNLIEGFQHIMESPAAPTFASAQEVAQIVRREYDLTWKLVEDAGSIQILNGGGEGGAEWHLNKALEVLCYYADGVVKNIQVTLKLPTYGFDDHFGRFGFKPTSENKVEVTMVRAPRKQGRVPIFAQTEDYPQGVFYLPVDKISFYDDPYRGEGDEGYDVEELKAAIAKKGFRSVIQVGRSLHDMALNGDYGVCVFNGNHRLAACKELGITEIQCENSEADDSDPLTKQDILDFGGRVR